jgi:hypothetical protein
MDRGMQHERTLRLLESKLEALACVSEHSLSAQRIDAHVDAAVAATRHAVELDLISAAEASEIWTRVARRHPDAHWCRDRRTRAA